MTTSTSSADGVRVASLFALGVEFAHSHGLEYALALIKQMGADSRTLLLLAERCKAEKLDSYVEVRAIKGF